MRSTALILLSGLLIFLQACNNNAKHERPHEVWVVRSVLDQKPRMISIALNDELWVAYNTQKGSLYKAWTGGINFDGSVYTAAHGPQPTSQGTTYLEEAVENPWRIIVNGKEEIPSVVYKGHTILNNEITLKYELLYNDKRVKVEEKPEFFKVNEKTGFERKYKLTDLPEGFSVGLKMHLTALIEPSDYETNGKFTVENKTTETLENKQYHIVDGTLFLNNDETTFSVRLVKRPELPKAEVKTSGEDAVFAIMAKSDCNTCHNKDIKTVGPAYIEIAKRYENSAQRLEELVSKVIKGGAGNWGDVPMTPHPNLSQNDAAAMVSYVLSLDATQEQEEAAKKLMPKPPFEITFRTIDPSEMEANAEQQGVAINMYQFSNAVMDFPEINGEMLPVVSGAANAIHTDNDFGDLKNNFAIEATGYLNIKTTTNLVFRLVSDDGSRLFVDGKLVIDNGGNHAMIPKDGELNLKAGKHPFKIEFYQGGGGGGLSLQWRPYGASEFAVVPPELFTFKGTDIKKTGKAPIQVTKLGMPGDGSPLVDAHPSFDLSQARPKGFEPKVGGMDFLSDGRLVISTWDSLGSVFILDGVQGKDAEAIKVKRIAYGLAEPLGLKVVDNEIYVLQKQELTKLVDLNNDDIIDQYQTVCNGWKVSANFHEFAFGLLYKDGYFYGTLATAINPGGASTKPQIPDRGKVVKISKEDGSHTLVATGLRTPNGIGYGVDNEIFIADNQGDWLPASKIVHLQEGAWYGSRSVDFDGTASLTETQPVVWLPQDDIGNSPSQPNVLNIGPYKNQMIHGDVTHGGIKRVFAEKVNGQYQGAVFRFTQGLEGGVNRLVWGPDQALYVGCVGSNGNWGHAGKFQFGLQRLAYNNKVTFEMLAVRAKPDGIEIEFAEPLKAGIGTKTEDYTIGQWWYKPTGEYGGPKLDEEALPIRAINVSADRKKVFLSLAGMKAKHLVYIRLNKETIVSEGGNKLWTTEAWYNMNQLPANTAQLE